MVEAEVKQKDDSILHIEEVVKPKEFLMPKGQPTGKQMTEMVHTLNDLNANDIATIWEDQREGARNEHMLQEQLKQMEAKAEGIVGQLNQQLNGSKAQLHGMQARLKFNTDMIAAYKRFPPPKGSPQEIQLITLKLEFDNLTKVHIPGMTKQIEAIEQQVAFHTKAWKYFRRVEVRLVIPDD